MSPSARSSPGDNSSARSSPGDNLRALSRSAVLFAILAFVAAIPAWIVPHPPLQDLPSHLATLRVVHSLHDPAFGLDRDFAVHLATPYLAYYLVGDLLAYVVGVHGAAVLLLIAYLAGTPFAIRALLIALGRDERGAFFSVPLLFNTMFILGLMPFLLGIPILFAGLALAVGHFAAPARKSGVVLGAVSLLLVFTHLVPAALLGVGVVALFPWRTRERWLASALPFVPALLALAWVLFATRTGGALLVSSPKVLSPAAHLSAAYGWTVDVLHGPLDEIGFLGLSALVLASFVLGGPLTGPARGLLALPLACGALYFATPESQGPIELFSQRFPALLLLTLVPLISIPQGASGRVIAVGALALAFAWPLVIAGKFIEFEAHEVGAFDDALAAMQPRKHVVGLIFDRDSKIVRSMPFLRFAEYYEVEKGGVAEHSSANFPHVPYAFLPGHEPPTGAPLPTDWEGMPERVGIDQIFPYFDYVLERGDGFHPPAGTYRIVYEGPRWRVWARTAG